MHTKFSSNDLTVLFLRQSLLDSQENYYKAQNNPSAPHFDVVILTASNEHQAQVFKEQLAIRKLPPATEFIVIPDPNGERVGSGGATLSAIKYVKEKYGTFSGKNIAVLHSGGDGKRTPSYSALGKLFSPAPRILPDGKASTLFDEFMISIASVPARMREGMILLSGDIMLLYNPLQIDFSGHGAAAISFKESAETGKNHGVFLAGENGNVKKFLHKQSVQTLVSSGAVNDDGDVSIDTGAVMFAPDILEALYTLVSDDNGVQKYINPKTRLSLYADFLYPLAEDSTLENFYKETPEGEFCDELHEARKIIWEILRPFRMKLLNFSPSKFVHFGTTKEIMKLMSGQWKDYEVLGWSNHVNSSASDETAGYNSVFSNGAEIGKGCYLEYSYIHHNAKIGNNCLLSFIDIHDEVIPDNVVLHGLKQSNGKFVCRIYGVDDNPKEKKIFGIELDTIEFIKNDNKPLWFVELYPECDTIKKAVDAALNLYNLIVNKKGDLKEWQKADKKSLCSGFNDADPKAIIDWSKRMEDLVSMHSIYKLIENGQPASQGKNIFNSTNLTKIQKDWLENKLNSLDTNNIDDFSTAIRLYWYVGVALNSDYYKDKCFKLISDTMLKSAINNLRYKDTVKIVKDKAVINLPLRVNWGGTWTDTPPYCIENGGAVLNAAIKINSKFPVTVTLIKIPEHKIIFDSRDMNAHGEFDTIEPLQDTGNPYDLFALQKGCLLACGIIPKSGGNLDEILTRLGGGFEMHSEVTNVPKGSGLGTSSILSAACVKAMLEFTGIECNDDDLYGYVLEMEQIMSTGGGWQDQVGGLTNGIKLVSSNRSLNQILNVEQIKITDETRNELNNRFCLIYTGQRRLARNILHGLLGNYLGNETKTIIAYKKLVDIANNMKKALEIGDIDMFADYMNVQWECTKELNPETSNTLIEYILLCIDNLIDSKLILGAGGGGFLQVILKKGVTKDDVHKRLKSVFKDFPVDVWNAELLY